MSQQETASSLDRAQMSQNLRDSLQRAVTYAFEQSHRVVTLEHLLLALAEDRDAAVILEASSVNIEMLTTDVSDFLGRLDDRVAEGARREPALGGDVQHIIRSAGAAAQKSGRRDVGSALVLAAVVGDGRSSAAQILRNRGLTFENAIAALKQANTASAARPVPQQPQAAARPWQPPPTYDKSQGHSSSRPRSPQAGDVSQPDLPAKANGSARLQNVQAAHDIIAGARERIAAARGAARSSQAASAKPPAETVAHNPKPVEAQSPATPRQDGLAAAPSIDAAPPAPNANETPAPAPVAQPSPVVPPSEDTSPVASAEPAASHVRDNVRPRIDEPPPEMSAPASVRLDTAGQQPPVRPLQDAAAAQAPSSDATTEIPSGFDPRELPVPKTPPPSNSSGSRPGRTRPTEPVRSTVADRRQMQHKAALPPNPQSPPERPVPPGAAQQRPPFEAPASPPPPRTEIATQLQPSDAAGTAAPPEPAPSKRTEPAAAPAPPRPTGKLPPRPAPQHPAAHQAPLPEPRDPTGVPAQTIARSGTSGNLAPAGPPHAPAPQKSFQETPAFPAPPPTNVQPIDPARLVEEFPKRMQVGVPSTVEVRAPRAELEAWSSGADPREAGEQIITKAMAMRLKAPEGGFTIETTSPETQWSGGSFDPLSDEFVSWRWTVTPTDLGRRPLQLLGSTRIVGRDGLSAARALPEQSVTVRVGPNYGRAAKRLAVWVAIAVAGIVLGYFADSVLTMGSSIFAQAVRP